MNSKTENLIKLAERFVRIPSFALAYGAFAKLYENEEPLYNFRISVLYKLLEMCLTVYNYDKYSSNLLNQWDLERQSLKDILTCMFCKSLFIQPTTLFCGHTFCRKCIDVNFTCHRCFVITKVDELNECLILSKVTRRLFPGPVQIGERLKFAADVVSQGKYDAALDIYSQLINENPDCYICMQAQAEAFLTVSKPEMVIKMIDKALNYQTMWPKLYCLKGVALSRLNHPRKALEYLFKCYTMYPHCDRLKVEIKKNFSEIYSDEDIENLKRIVEICSEASGSIDNILNTLPSNLRVLIPLNFWMVYSTASVNNVAIMSDSAANQLSEELVKEMYEEFKCALCLRILMLPVTPPCGHSFCSECLEKCLDYKPECPLCKRNLSVFITSPNHCVNICLSKVVKHFFVEEVGQRLSSYQSELVIMSKMGTDPQYDVPAILCCIALPGIPCPLHVYEPHYRAMLRRVILSGSRQFAVFTPGSSYCGLTEIGTIIRIKNVEILEDGRFLVDAIGCRRIRIFSACYMDGCLFVKYEFFKDLPVDQTEHEAYMNDYVTVYDMASRWVSSLANDKKNSLVQFSGNLPNIHSDSPEGDQNGPPVWVWWMIFALPLADRCKYSMLSCNKPELRMQKLKNLLNHLLSDKGDLYSSGNRLTC